MQKWGLKLLCAALFAVSSLSTNAQVFEYRLHMADSLFLKKQYTQSMELYREIFESGSYSSAMLLKMAFIEEGLGQTALSLYYLNYYYLLTADKKAVDKMQEIAERNNLKGYSASVLDGLLLSLQDVRPRWMIYLACGLVVFSMGRFFTSRKGPAYVMFAMSVLFAAGLLFFTNIDFEKQFGISYHGPAYLMSGPSPGSSVVAIIGEGHRLTIKGKEDVWTKVSWGGEELFVKENQLIEVKL